MSPPPESSGGGGQASQPGDAPLLGSDLKIPAAFYDGGGVQKVDYESGQDFIDDLHTKDGIFYFYTFIGELEMRVAILSYTEFGDAGKLPAFGYALNTMSDQYFAPFMVTLSESSLNVSFSSSGNERVGASDLLPGYMSAFLF